MTSNTYTHDNDYLFYRRVRVGDNAFHYKGVPDFDAAESITAGDHKWLLVCTKVDGEFRRYYPLPLLLEQGWVRAPGYALDALEAVELVLEAFAASLELPAPTPLPEQENVTSGLVGRLTSMFRR